MASKKYKIDNVFQKGAFGEFIDIDGDKYHAYITGQGKDTLVFLAGEGVPSPILDFKPLWLLQKDEFRIVILEKAGYGFSDVTNKSRDIATLVSDNRTLLKKLNIKQPYILVSHSLSGLEAIYWAQNFTNEIKAIISLDMSIPSILKITKIPSQTKLAMFLFSIFKNTDITNKRAFKLTKKLPSFSLLNDEDKSIYLNIIKHRFMTVNMINEIKLLNENIKTTEKNSYPKNVPLLFFSSDLIDTAKNANTTPKKLLQLQKDFIADFSYTKHIQLSCNHFIHAYESSKIAYEIKNFINYINFFQ